MAVCSVCPGFYLCCNPGKSRPAGLRAAQHQRNQRRARLDNLQAELPRQLIAQPCCTQFGNREAAGRYYEGD